MIIIIIKDKYIDIILYHIILYYIVLYYIIIIVIILLYYIMIISYYIILYYIILYLSIIFTVPYFTRESCHLGHPPSFGHTNLRDEGCDPKLQLSPTPSAVSYCEDIHALQLKTRWRAACGEFLGESKLTWSRCIKYVSNIRLKVHMNELWLKAICAEEVRNVQIQGAHSPWTTAKTCKVNFQKLLDHAWSLFLYRSSSETVLRCAKALEDGSTTRTATNHGFAGTPFGSPGDMAPGLEHVGCYRCGGFVVCASKKWSINWASSQSVKPHIGTDSKMGCQKKQLVIGMKKTRWHTHNSRWSNLP